MIAYRYQKKDGEWQWLQTSSRLVYKNSKPDFVISTHRQLMDEEGKDLLGKRTMDFKVCYHFSNFSIFMRDKSNNKINLLHSKKKLGQLLGYWTSINLFFRSRSAGNATKWIAKFIISKQHSYTSTTNATL